MPHNNRVPPYREEPRLSDLAIYSIILAIVSIPLNFVFGADATFGLIAAVAAFIFGIVALVWISLKPHQYGGTGFALTGIAISVGSVLLLASLPPLGGSHIMARTVQCLSNLKSLGLASYMYQNDYSGLYPAAGSATPVYNDWVYWQPGRDVNKGMLVPYMGNIFKPKPYTCPDDATAAKRPANVYQYSYTANVNVFINENSTAAGIPNTPLNFKKIRNPAMKIMLVEEDSASIDDAAWEPQRWKARSAHNILSVRHFKMTTSATPNTGNANACFADGHSEWVQRADAMTAHFYDPLVP